MDDLEPRRLGVELDAATRIEVAPKSTAATRMRYKPGRDVPRAARADDRRAVAEAAERVEGIERGTVAPAGFGDERADVGAVRGLQHLGRERRVVGVLRVGERGAVDSRLLRERDLDLVGGLDEVLERILEVVLGSIM